MGGKPASPRGYRGPTSGGSPSGRGAGAGPVGGAAAAGRGAFAALPPALVWCGPPPGWWWCGWWCSRGTVIYLELESLAR